MNGDWLAGQAVLMSNFCFSSDTLINKVKTAVQVLMKNCKGRKTN